MSATPSSFKALIPDPSGSKCAAFTRALLELPNLLYQWMFANTDSSGKVKGSSKPGDIIMSAAPSSPDASRLLCDGSEVSKTTYALLYTVLGTTWGTAGSADNFKLPDLRGRFPCFVGNTAKPIAINLAGTGGEDEHILTTAELPAHAHAIQTNSAGKAGDSLHTVAQPDDITGFPLTTNQSTEETGGDDPHTNMPPWVGLHAYVITGLGV